MNKFRVGDRVRRNVESMGDIFQAILKDTGKSNTKWSDIKMHKGNKGLSTFGLEVSTKDKGAK